MNLNDLETGIEENYLSQTISVLETNITNCENDYNQVSKKIAKLNEFFIEGRSDMDGPEMHLLNNEIIVQNNIADQLYEKINRLNKVKSSPYFGRVDFKYEETCDQETIYIGLSTIIDQDRFYTYDWRTPIASLFYDYELGKANYNTSQEIVEGEVLRKRQFKIENSIIKYAFENSLNIDDEYLQSVLSSKTEEKMKHIVNSIQKEQNSVIRNNSNVLIVEGPAGCGKSSIAMHRVAYLLFKNRENLKSDEVLIFSPSEEFSEYISNILPELGERNARNMRYDDLAYQLETKLKSESHALFVNRVNNLSTTMEKDLIRMKTSDRYVDLIHLFVDDLLENFNWKDIIINRKLIVAKEDCKKLIMVEYCNLPIARRFEKLLSYLMMKVNHSFPKRLDQIKLREVIQKKINFDCDIQWIIQQMYNSEFMMSMITESFPEIDILELGKKLNSEGFNRKKCNYEDGLVYLYLKSIIVGFEADKSVKQVVIDEAQDYTRIHFELLRKLFAYSKFTILGDSNQSVVVAMADTNLDRLENFFVGFKLVEKLNLTKTYRSSFEITKFCNKILNLKNVNPMNRHNKQPFLYEGLTEKEIERQLYSILRELTNGSDDKIAVLTKTTSEAENLRKFLSMTDKIEKQDKPLFIMPIFLAKGLEFDKVIVYDKSETGFLDEDAKLLYVACSRALHELYILSKSKQKLLSFTRE